MKTIQTFLRSDIIYFSMNLKYKTCHLIISLKHTSKLAYWSDEMYLCSTFKVQMEAVL